MRCNWGGEGEVSLPGRAGGEAGECRLCGEGKDKVILFLPYPSPPTHTHHASQVLFIYALTLAATIDNFGDIPCDCLT